MVPRILFLAAFCGAIAPAADDPPRTWIDPDTGHRIVRLTSEPGSASLYFNQNGYTADGKKMVYTTPGGISVLDLATHASKSVVQGRVRAIVTGRKTQNVYYTREGAVWSTDVDTGTTREIAKLPPRGSVATVNADETLLAGTYIEGGGQDYNANRPQQPQTLDQPRNKGQMMEQRLAARLPMALFTIDAKTGEVKVIHKATDWLNHLLFSPTDPTLLMFCLEGPWHKVDRIWTIRTDGGQRTKIHTRTMAMEIFGHEFWSYDGKTIWYDLQTPRGEDFWLAGYKVETGERTWYHLQRNEWSIHFNVTRDGTLICGDGGDEGQVAHAPDGKWIYLFRPEPIKNRGIEDKSFVNPGVLRAERLVNMSKHQYRLEPNVSFTPDQKWVVFRSNMFGATYVFAVEVAKAGQATRAPSPAPAAAAACDSLASLALPGATIAMARPVAAGEFTLPAPTGPGPAMPPALFKNLPAFCRVAATLAPSQDSEIKIEVWMPASGWNNKLQAVGNGGWSGAISYPSLARALARGYATASTDTGHEGGSGRFALGHPEKLIDFGYRAVHEMTVKAKAILAAYYGDGPKLSYWNGCSSGGKQGLKEAQRFPADYDGIIAGAPANYWTHLMIGELWIAQAVHKDEASFIPPGKFSLIHKAAVEACDARDGVKDGVLEDPTACSFDPKALECKGDDTSACLTAAQVETARKIYGAARNTRTGQEIFPGLERGSELGWAGLAGAQPFPIPVDHFRYVVFKDPGWDWRALNFDSDVALADKLDNGLLNATDPNLKAFAARGGKLLLYHGWNDQLIAPRNAVNYYKSVMDTVGAQTADSIRLFMVPGMGHCAGGEGTSTFDTVSVIEEWVEKGKAPEQIVASRMVNGKVERTRPLCPYPQVAQYKGSGSTDEAANFVCKAP